MLDGAAGNPPVLFIWQSRPAVVIGKHQNPWRECNLDWMKAHDVLLARRHTGGGAVYHDEGNLNFAYFMPRAEYEADTVFRWVEAALARLDVHVSRMNRTSLAVSEGKVSGNAFCFRKNGAQHHGTLLVNADLSNVEAALRAPDWTFDTRATPSIRAKVINLADVRPGLSLQDVVDALSQGLAVAPIEDWIDHEAASSCAKERQLDEWLYGKTPTFTVTIDGRAIEVKQGRIVSIEPTDNHAHYIGTPFSAFQSTP